MHSNSRVARSMATLLAAWLLLFITMCNAASARIGASTAKALSIHTLAWGNVLTNVGDTATHSPFMFTWAQSSGAQYTYVDLVNVGTLTTLGNSITVTTQDATSSRQDAPSLTFSVCTNGTWNQTAHTCSGSSTNLGTVTNGTLNSTLSLVSGQRVTLRILAQKTKKALWTSTMSIGVNRSQLRTATVTHS